MRTLQGDAAKLPTLQQANNELRKQYEQIAAENKQLKRFAEGAPSVAECCGFSAYSSLNERSKSAEHERRGGGTPFSGGGQGQMGGMQWQTGSGGGGRNVRYTQQVRQLVCRGHMRVYAAAGDQVFVYIGGHTIRRIAGELDHH
jgi:hypothetical protein